MGINYIFNSYIMKQFLINYTYGLFYIHERIWRLQYFLSTLFFVIWSLILLMFCFVSFWEFISLNFFLFLWLYLLLLFIWLTMIKVRRLHDLNISWWWSPIFTIVEIIPIIWLIPYFYLLFKKWTQSKNKYSIDWL